MLPPSFFVFCAQIVGFLCPKKKAKEDCLHFPLCLVPKIGLVVGGIYPQYRPPDPRNSEVLPGYCREIVPSRPDAPNRCFSKGF